MDKFRETMQGLAKMSPEEQASRIEKLKGMCTCPSCPTYNNCAGNASEKLFCALGRSFHCISFERGCICPTCPVTTEMGLHYDRFCTRDSEKAQRYENTVWGSSMLKEKQESRAQT